MKADWPEYREIPKIDPSKKATTVTNSQRKIAKIALSEMKIHSRNEANMGPQSNYAEAPKSVSTKKQRGANSFGTFGRGPRNGKETDEPSPPVSYVQEASYFTK